MGIKGKKGRKMKNTKNTTTMKARPIPLKDTEGQVYGKMVKNLGDHRVECICDDQVTRVCRKRRTHKFFKENPLAEVGCIMLISVREENPAKGDVIAIYHPHEYQYLKRNNYIEFDMEEKEEDETGFEFERIENTNNPLNFEVEVNKHEELNIDDI